ncbi:MFS general substrate transporter [Ceraceosorus guamensis]|uniref:MFS general substrate transporter n=1 Tax=Ceraceosorus guamensis TaxID=1522189 RepID=A0A316W315_9BASI|nr:MFS general substrate transporter [Ceraceosorus guamensis]PWN43488.1 MFS general substrate transporter [Ceraceosorus guamensis]
MSDVEAGRRRSRRQTILAASAIGACSVTAGSIFCFPLFAPNLTRDLGLSLTQTNAIWAGAVLGEYITAGPWGALADARGPRPLCISAALLFGAGYALMAGADAEALRARMNATEGAAILQSALAIDDTKAAQAAGLMMGYFLLVGAGVAASFFASLRAATHYFPSHPSLALSIPSTLFSLSSLFLTQLADLPAFKDASTGDLSAPSFLGFLGALLAVVNVFGAFAFGGYHGVVSQQKEEEARQAIERASASQESSHQTGHALPGSETVPAGIAPPTSLPVPEQPSEATPLLRGDVESDRNAPAMPATLPLVSSSPSFRAYLRSPAFWSLTLLLFAAAGGAEMVMSSVGSMVVSLLAVHATDASQIGREELKVRTRLVGVLATTNTISRLLAGLASDALDPTRPFASSSEVTRAQSPIRRALHRLSQIRMSRVTILMAGQSILLLSFVYAASALDSIAGLSALCSAVGAGYGMLFTLIPSVILIAWGQQHFGRNWGSMTYAAAAGSLGFSILFAQVSDSVAQRTQNQANAALHGFGAEAMKLGAARAFTAGLAKPSFGDACLMAHGVLVQALFSSQDGSAGRTAGLLGTHTPALDSVAGLTQDSLPADKLCLVGRACFGPSFAATSAVSLVALIGILPLWYRWRSRL